MTGFDLLLPWLLAAELACVRQQLQDLRADSVTVEINTMEQYSRDSDLEIQSVPENKSQNVVD